MFLSHADLITELGYKYVEMIQNNAAYIYSMEMHVGTVDKKKGISISDDV